MRSRMLKVGLLLPILLLLGACDPLEKNARDSIAAAKGFIEKAQEHHASECIAMPSKPLCAAITKAVAAQNVAVDALHLYCSGAPSAGNAAYDAGGPCAPSKGVEPRLRIAIRDLDRIIAEAKGVVQ